MQCSAFIITLCSLFAFRQFFSTFILTRRLIRAIFFSVAVSFALASPLPVQAIREVRETTIELRARQVPVDHEILHREVSADAESDITLQILAREHKTYEEYVQGVRVPLPPVACKCLT